MNEYGESVGLSTTPIVLDTMSYYTPAEGYQALSALGPGGRNAYRLLNYVDFVVPFANFLSLSLSNIALGSEGAGVTFPFMYLIADFAENLAERFVLDIYPRRNDAVMTLACYFGLIKMLFAVISALILMANIFTSVYRCIIRSRSTPDWEKIQ